MGIVACINRNKWSHGGAQKKWKGTHKKKDRKLIGSIITKHAKHLLFN